MRVDQIPPELAAMLDDAAGMQHSATGSVRAALADILTRYEHMRRPAVKAAHILMAAADKLGATHATFPPDIDEHGWWAEATLVIEGDTVQVRVEVR